MLRPDLAQEFRRSRIDADGLIFRPPHDVADGRAGRRGEERIAGEMDERRALDQRVWDVAGFELFVGAAIGEETAFAVRVNERDQPPGLMGSIADEMRRDADRFEARLSRSTSAAPTRATKSTPAPNEASHAA